MRQPGHRQSAMTSPPSTANEDSSYHRQFVFDTAGNWDWFKLGSDPNTPYIPDNLNLYASINDPNDPNTATESFTYDEDQNLTEDGSFEYAYDAENRLSEAVPAEDGSFEYAYDAENRLITITLSSIASPRNSGQPRTGLVGVGT